MSWKVIRTGRLSRLSQADAKAPKLNEEVHEPSANMVRLRWSNLFVWRTHLRLKNCKDNWKRPTCVALSFLLCTIAWTACSSRSSLRDDQHPARRFVSRGAKTPEKGAGTRGKESLIDMFTASTFIILRASLVAEESREQDRIAEARLEEIWRFLTRCLTFTSQLLDIQPLGWLQC